jgi:hypothetical protein
MRDAAASQYAEVIELLISCEPSPDSTDNRLNLNAIFRGAVRVTLVTIIGGVAGLGPRR